jgi:hypothetical protein
LAKGEYKTVIVVTADGSLKGKQVKVQVHLLPGVSFRKTTFAGNNQCQVNSILPHPIVRREM